MSKYIRRITATVFFVTAMVSALFAGPQTDQGAKQDIKDAGHETKQAAKDTGRATKKTARKTGRKVKRTSKKVVHKTAAETKEGAQKVEDKTDPH